MESPWGWADSAQALLETDADDIESALVGQSNRLGIGASSSQVGAWRESIALLRSALGAIEEPTLASWSVIFEYELPLEGGRRPDVVILAGGSVVVLEFKQDDKATQAALDQVGAYARDLADYHGGTAGRPVVPVLVLTQTETINADFDPVLVCGAAELTSSLRELGSPGAIDLKAWLDSDYEPLPTLVAAARRVFREEPLHHVRTALSSGIPATLQHIAAIADAAERNSERHLVLLDGVPGSGKTLVGLRLIYELPSVKGRGLLLSGNGPLVAVLQDALQSRVFVRDLHAFIRSYGIQGKTPQEHIVVFDEAQRAWDENFMQFKKGVSRSEPELLVEIGSRIPGWCLLVGLVGSGQEIYSGEEAGLGQWRDAVLGSSATWMVHASPTLAGQMAGVGIKESDLLSLSRSLRSHRAEYLHEWVNHLLNGSLALARRVASRLEQDAQAFDMYLTRDLDEAKQYARSRYAGEPDKRFGLLVGAHARAPRKYGVDNNFMVQSRMKIGRWFNAAQDDPHSCCQFGLPVTEFQVQGLELDLPIVCWGDDYLWDGPKSKWRMRPARSRYPQEDPDQLLMNSYRVLLTRGRDGMVVFLPPEAPFDQTEIALLAAGLRPLELLPTSRLRQTGEP